MIRIGDRVKVFEKWPKTKGLTFVVVAARDGIIYCKQDDGLLRAFPADCVDEIEGDENRSSGPTGG